MNVRDFAFLFYKIAQENDLKKGRFFFKEIISNLIREINNGSGEFALIKSSITSQSIIEKSEKLLFDGKVQPGTEIPTARYIKEVYNKWSKHFIDAEQFIINWILFLLAKHAKEKLGPKIKYPYFTNLINAKAIIIEIFNKAYDEYKEQQKYIVPSLKQMIEDDSNYETIPFSISENDYSLIEYYKPTKPGDKKIRETTTFGRYLRRKFNITDKDVPDNIIALIANEYSKPISMEKGFGEEIKQLEGKDIQETYTDMDVKVHSCMTGEHSRYVEIFALNPDKVKLVTYKKNARALLWTCDDGAKVLDRSYPAGSKYIPLLRTWAKSNGIILRDNPDSLETDDVDLEDGTTRYVTLKHEGTFPYMDTFKYGSQIQGNIDNKGVIKLSNKKKNNNMQFTSLSGNFSYLEGAICYSCEGFFPENNVHYVDGNNYCNDCFNERFFTCADCGRDVRFEVLGGTFSDESFCDSCFFENFFNCVSCDTTFPMDKVVVTKDGETYCETCAEDELKQCPSCDEFSKIHDFTEIKTFPWQITVDEDGEIEKDFACETCASKYNQCEECADYVDYKLIDERCYECVPELYLGQLKLPLSEKDIQFNKEIESNFVECRGCGKIIHKTKSIKTSDNYRYCTTCVQGLVKCYMCEELFPKDSGEITILRSFTNDKPICMDDLVFYVENECKNCHIFTSYKLKDELCHKCDPTKYI